MRGRKPGERSHLVIWGTLRKLSGNLGRPQIITFVCNISNMGTHCHIFFVCKTISRTPFHRSGCDTYLIAGSCWSVIVNLSNSANAVYILSQLKYNLLQQNPFPELRCALVDFQDSHKSWAMREPALQGSRVFDLVDRRSC